jgi:hypothetical protein
MSDKKDFVIVFLAMVLDEAILMIFRLGTHFIWWFSKC